MQLVPLSTDGRVTALGGPPLPVPGRLQVVLEPDIAGVRVIAVGQQMPRPVGRLDGHDVAAYRPVLLRLAEQGFLGACPAEVTVAGTLVLDLAPASHCVFGNFPGDLVLLAPQRTVTVTREEHHQEVLAGRTGRVAVALRPSAIIAGKYAGQRGLEVMLDGRRVGELTRLMAERYLSLVDEVAARGRRAGCEALLRPDDRGVQVELRLPAVEARVRPATESDPTAPARTMPPPRSIGPQPVSVRSASPGTSAPPVPTALHPPSLALSAPRRRSRHLLGVTGAVVGVLVLASAFGNSGDDGRTTPTSTLPAAVATPQPANSTRATADPIPTTETIDEPVVAAAAPATRRQAATPRSTTAATRSTPARTTTAPAPPRVAPPKPRAAEKPASSGCDPNYSGCVPIASDVDCAGGRGNGPAYVSGPVRVIGSDVYGLDNDHDGFGCE
jgi:hypothetical protein